jgi:hypothetical protein
MLDRIDGDDPAQGTIGVFDPERAERAGGKHFERLAVEQHAARIFRLFVEIVAERLQAALQFLLAIGGTDLQAEAGLRPTRRRRQPFHDGLCSRHQEYRLLGLGKAPQNRASPARDLARGLQTVERQIVQSREHQRLDRRIERVDHASQTLRPVLVVAQKDEAVAAGLSPLLDQMEGQHAERR